MLSCLALFQIVPGLACFVWSCLLCCCYYALRCHVVMYVNVFCLPLLSFLLSSLFSSYCHFSLSSIILFPLLCSDLLFNSFLLLLSWLSSFRCIISQVTIAYIRCSPLVAPSLLNDSRSIASVPIFWWCSVFIIIYGSALDTVHSHVCVGVLVLICVIVPDFTFVLVLFVCHYQSINCTWLQFICVCYLIVLHYSGVYQIY